MAVVSVLAILVGLIVDRNSLRKAFRELEEAHRRCHHDILSDTRKRLAYESAGTKDYIAQTLEGYQKVDPWKDEYNRTKMNDHDKWIFRLRCMLYEVSNKMAEADTDVQLNLKYLLDSSSYIDRAVWTKCIESMDEDRKDYTPEDALDYDEDGNLV